MAVTPLPIPPSRADAENFAERADTFLGALPVFADELNVVQVDVNAKQLLAASSETNAAASALASANTADATIWVSGTTYAIGDNRFSPINFLTYRRKTAGTGTTDPSLDSTNWALLTGLGDATLTGTQTFTGAKTFNNITSATIGTLNGGQLAGLRNRIINGGMQVAQRGTVVITTLPQYGALDRMMFSIEGGTSISGFPVQTATSGFESGYAMVASAMSWTNGQPVFTHRIEARNVQDLNSKVISVGFKLKHDIGSATNFTVRISKANASDNFSTVTTIATSSSYSIPNNTITPVSVQFTLGASDATNGVQIEVFATTPLTVTSKSISFGDFQLELGSVATAFENRPYGMELALCQRYLPSISAGWGRAYGASAASFLCMLTVDARVAPTGLTTTIGAFLIDGSSLQTANSIIFAGGSTKHIQFNAGSATGFATPNEPVKIYSSSTKILGTGCEL